MPIYSYRCPVCKKEVDVYRRDFLTSDGTAVYCTYCDSKMMRLYNVPTVIYNTGGFYSKDNDRINH